MPHSLIFTAAARLEVIAAYEWYERESRGLGARFTAAINNQAERITNDPKQFPIALKDIRRARLQRFPYSLFFQLRDDAIYVLACFHASRDPMIWRGRI